MVEVIGYLAAICLAMSGIPFALSALRSGEVNMSMSGILLVLAGMMGMLVYELGTAVSIPQVVDFSISSVCWSVVLYYKLLPRRKNGLHERESKKSI